jgi:NADPH:quinone reductase-like Zn-dependent oxidoreductase
MNAAVVESYDRPPRYTSFAEPVAADGEVLVKVTAAGLHPIVKALANGTHYGSTGQFPFVPGVDGVGLTPDRKRVFFGVTRPPYGSFGEQTVTRPFLCVPVPDGLDDVAAAALGNPGMSSRAALMRAGFAAGEGVLILGATGVAGQLAVQIARRLGASRVVAVGRNPSTLAETKLLGADAAISLELELDALVEAFRAEVAEGKIHVVLDYLWGQPAEALLAAIAKKGLSHAAPRIRYVQIGSSAGPTIALAAATLRSSGLELLGSGFGSASLEQIMKAVGELFEEGAKKPFKNDLKVMALHEIEAAWGERESATRIVFRP